MTRGIDYIGKYEVLEERETTKGDILQVPVLYTDNCREAVWIANMNPLINTPKNICGERDFYRDSEGWHSFEL
jgi:hypothetical protein